MSEIIASTYEIKKRIGSGGGGIVFLAWHLRLEKDVVLKADKRKINTDEELLRREVNVLKNLNHAHIPHVYDFFVENDTVCTVIDFIQGESLDKPLKRGEHFSQAQVIEWGRQLLDALSYLHSPTHGDPPHGYVHSDIKPANIMRTPDGDICLIDFNIALAIGEESIVGLSEGYASPEHYGLDYSSGGSDVTEEREDNSANAIIPEISNGNLNDKTCYESNSADTTLESQISELTDKQSNETRVESETAMEESTVLENWNLQDPKSNCAPIPEKELKTIFLDATEQESFHPDNEECKNVNAKTPVASNIPSKKTVIPDVRSDIYSVGATLYHLLSGRRPAKDAKEVEPLSSDAFSPLVVEIITKAMNPNPDLRYQTADEMLDALNRLYTNDSRVIQLKRETHISFILVSICFIIGILTSFTGLKSMQESESRLKLIEYSKNALDDGNPALAVEYALEAASSKFNFISSTAAAQKALTDALGVYDLSDSYKSSQTIELNSEPIYVSIAPDGSTVACICSSNVVIFNTETGDEIARFPAQNSALAEAKYLDNNTLIFAGADGVTAYSITKNRTLWSSAQGTSLSISDDGKYIAFVYRDEPYATIIRATDGSVAQIVDFGERKQSVAANDIAANPNDNLFALNSDGTLLAVSFSDGSLQIFNLYNADKNIIVFDKNSGYTHFEGGFHDHYFAFSATGIPDSVFAIIDTNSEAQTGGFQSEYSFSTVANASGIYVQTDNLLVKIDPETGEQTPLVTTNEKIISYAVSDEQSVISTQNGFSFFGENAQLLTEYKTDYRCDFLQIAKNVAVIGGMDTSAMRILQADNHFESEVFSYDPTIKHSEVRLSADSETVMLFSYDRFYLYDIDGTLITKTAIPEAEEVYDQQFIRDGTESRLEVTYNDGRVIAYDASDGQVLYENQQTTPDRSLEEKFETNEYQIYAPLHGAPTVFDKKTGKELCQLNEDAFLTYIIEVDQYIIAQYMTADGYYYGRLMNSKLEELAELPFLCDVINDTLYFDYPTGNVRKSRIYNTEEIITFANYQGGVDNE